jgi:hypothetical protein
MRAEVGLGVLLSPPVENLGEHGSLAAPSGPVLLQHEHEVALVSYAAGGTRLAMPLSPVTSGCSQQVMRLAAEEWLSGSPTTLCATFSQVNGVHRCGQGL